MRFFAFAVAFGLGLSACATTPPSARIADALSGYGLDRTRAECVGGHLQRDLSVGQLLELGRAVREARARDPNPARVTADDLLRVSGNLRDPAIAIAVAKAAGRCGLVPLGFIAGADLS